MANFLPPIDLGQWKPSSAAISSWLYEIWKYLQENPISSEEELAALINERVPEEITEYLAEHPITAPVTSVNTQTGNVVISYGDLTANMTFPIVYPDDIGDLSSQSFLLSAYADGARFAFWAGTNTLYVLDKVGDTVTPVAVGGSGGGGGDGAILSINTSVVPDAAGNAVLTGQSIPVSSVDTTSINSALGSKATTSALNSAVTALETSIAGKADNAAFTGSTELLDGSSGLVPAPGAGSDTRVLCADGTWRSAGGGSIDTLWVNSNPTSSFSAQTITLSSSVDNYDFWVIEFNAGPAMSNAYSSTIMFGVHGGMVCVAAGASAATTNGSISRGFSMTIGTEIVWAAAYSYSSTDNSRVIPVAVYGVNL